MSEPIAYYPMCLKCHQRHTGDCLQAAPPPAPQPEGELDTIHNQRLDDLRLARAPADPAPSGEHGLAPTVESLFTTRCECGQRFDAPDATIKFNAHFRAEVRRETLMELREKSLELAKFFRAKGDNQIAEQYVFMAEWLRSQSGK